MRLNGIFPSRRSRLLILWLIRCVVELRLLLAVQYNAFASGVYLALVRTLTQQPPAAAAPSPLPATLSLDVISLLRRFPRHAHTC